MKKILCFGDSNTYGYNPHDMLRYNKNERWTGILSSLLNGAYEVTEGGANNRTGFVENPQGEDFTGYCAIKKYNLSEFNIIILAIGINDLQKSYALDLTQIENGIKNLIKIVHGAAPKAKILLLAPPHLTKDILNGFFAFQFDLKSIEKSRRLPAVYKTAAEDFGIDYIDLNSVAQVSSLDGLHYSKEAHIKIAYAVFEFIKNSLNDGASFSAAPV